MREWIPRMLGKQRRIQIHIRLMYFKIWKAQWILDSECQRGRRGVTVIRDALDSSI